MTKHLALVLLVICLLSALVVALGCGEKGRQATPAAGGGPAGSAPGPATTTGPVTTARADLMKTYHLSAPASHDNLTLFYIYGDDTLKGEEFMTLQEALEAKALTVHETGNVNELKVSNTGNRPVYVQAGEIVRGGKQDRCLPQDMVIAPGTKEAPLESFCVEHGRWTARGNENVAGFDASANMANNSVVAAAVKSRDQQEVWAEVDKQQKALTTRAGTGVIAGESASSLELTMNSKALADAIKPYTDELSGSLKGQKRVVGMAVAINGEVVKMDIYGSSALFAKLYPKLLKASAADAVAAKQKDKTFPAAKAEDVWVAMEDSRSGNSEQRRTNAQTIMRVTDGKDGSFSYGAAYAPSPTTAPTMVREGMLKQKN